MIVLLCLVSRPASCWVKRQLKRMLRLASSHKSRPNLHPPPPPAGQRDPVLREVPAQEGAVPGRGRRQRQHGRARAVHQHPGAHVTSHCRNITYKLHSVDMAERELYINIQVCKRRVWKTVRCARCARCCLRSHFTPTLKATCPSPNAAPTQSAHPSMCTCTEFAGPATWICPSTSWCRSLPVLNCAARPPPLSLQMSINFLVSLLKKNWQVRPLARGGVGCCFWGRRRRL